MISIMPETLNHDKAKEAAGRYAAELVQPGMVLGLGTGSTAAQFIKHLILRCKEGLKVKAVASSIRSQKLAEEGGIPLLDPNTLSSLDMTIDGADEIDNQKRMIKGGGGALLREKIIAAMSKEMVVVIDESKRVAQLGAFPLPIEIVPFAYKATLEHLKRLGFQAHLRYSEKGQIYQTDSSHYIADIHFPDFIQNPEEVQFILKKIPGIIETGLFLNLAGRVIIGHSDGRVTLMNGEGKKIL